MTNSAKLNVPIFVISLTRSTDRRADIKRRLDADGVAFEFVDAVDGAKLDLTEYQHRLTNDLFFARGGESGGLSAAAVGCFLSHYNLWQHIADKKIPFTLILEDDCAWDDNFFQIAQRIVESDYYWNIVNLGAVKKKSGKFRVIDDVGGGHQLMQPAHLSRGCFAYLIDRDGAEKMLTQCYLIRDAIDMQWRRYWESNCYFYELQPYISNVNDSPSNIAGSFTVDSRRRYKNGVWRWLWGEFKIMRARQKFCKAHPPIKRKHKI